MNDQALLKALLNDYPITLASVSTIISTLQTSETISHSDKYVAFRLACLVYVCPVILCKDYQLETSSQQINDARRLIRMLGKSLADDMTCHEWQKRFAFKYQDSILVQLQDYLESESLENPKVCSIIHISFNFIHCR